LQEKRTENNPEPLCLPTFGRRFLFCHKSLDKDSFEGFETPENNGSDAKVNDRYGEGTEVETTIETIGEIGNENDSLSVTSEPLNQGVNDGNEADESKFNLSTRYFC
jgi:hypothetical protein